MTRRTMRCFPLLIVILNLMDLACYQMYTEPERACASDSKHAVLDPSDSVVVCIRDDDEVEIEPNGEVRFSGGDCPGEACDFHVHELALVFPEIEMAGHVIAAGSVMHLEGGDAGGNVNELGGVSLLNTTFPVVFEGSIDGIPFSTRYMPVNNVGGGYDSEKRILVLLADLVPTPNGDGAWASWLPDIHLLVTAYDDCSDEAP